LPKLACPCGFVHDLSPIPDEGWITVRDREYETLIDAELARRAGDRSMTTRVIGLRGSLYQCPECGRLMWEKPGERTFSVYKPEALHSHDGETGEGLT
jgi:hypothetical protein